MADDVQQIILEEIREMRSAFNGRFDRLDSRMDRQDTKLNHATERIAVQEERSKRGRWAISVVGGILGIVATAYALIS